MKKEWNAPEIASLSVEETEGGPGFGISDATTWGSDDIEHS